MKKEGIRKRRAAATPPLPSPRKGMKFDKLNPSRNLTTKRPEFKRDLETCQRLLNAHPDIALLIDLEGCVLAGNLIEELGDKIRTISSGIHPDMIENLGLVPAIEWYLETYFKNISGIHYEFKTNCKDKNLGQGIDIVLYRIIQESLNNVIRHARASSVYIFLEAESRVVRLKIQDNGIGFDFEDALSSRNGERTSMGLLSMRERAASVGGRFLIQTTPGNGTSVIVTVTVKKGAGE